MAYNLTGMMENSTTVLGFVQGVNQNLSEGWFGTLLLIGLTLIILMSVTFSSGRFSKGLITSSYIGMLLAILMTAMSLISTLTMIMYIVIAAISLGVGVLSER